MKSLILALLMTFTTTVYSETITTWYAGTSFQGSVETSGFKWSSRDDICILSGPYGDGLSMEICQELSAKVGGLTYYYNDAGKGTNKHLLDECNEEKIYTFFDLFL